jgi:lysophospholipase L1-like esterase
MKKTILATCLVALLAAAPAMAQVDFTSYVALGDSLTAGFASGSFMNWYQERSYPAVLAHQAGAPVFEQPTISEPGIPAILELVSLLQDGQLRPVIAPVGLIPGMPTNAYFPGIYNNMGIPGATLYDMLFRTGDLENFSPANAMFDLVLRDGIHTAIEFAIGAQPTFATVWIGNNDVLPALLAGTPIDGVTMTPVETFTLLYNNAIGALATNTTADIVLINIPYSTETPFATSLDPFVDIPVLGRWYLVADTGVLTDDDLVTAGAGGLIAQGYGLPGGPPLPDNLDMLTGSPGYVLRPGETEAINDRIDAYNAIIADVAALYGYPVFDVNAYFADIVSGINLPLFGGVELTADFLLGGIFSYDGIHTQNIGSALVADELIQFINAEYGDSIPRVNMAEVLFEGDWQDPGVLPEKASDIVMSPDAFEQLYKIFGPKLERTPQVRRPAAGSSDTGTSVVRRKPGPRP